MEIEISQSKQRRFLNTCNFLESSDANIKSILDLGTPNNLSMILNSKGYTVQNTDIDLDKNPELLKKYNHDTATAFEILEHLLNPLSVLENLNAKRLFATIPLRLWFKGAYKNPNDPWDRHFHEFEDWQFDWLLDHAGWKIIRSEKWANPSGKIGIRPLLRRYTPRYYAVEAIRK